jgi:GT2 family glycosyltransferase
MKIAIYTLTRERLEYSKLCLNSIKDKSGYPFDHYIIDNGSMDDTPKWLEENKLMFKKIVYNSENLGIAKAANIILKEIKKSEYDIIIKMDNDCMIKSNNILKEIVKIYNSLGNEKKNFILSPRVEGIGKQPRRVRYIDKEGYKIGMTSIVGGLFHIVPIEIYKNYIFQEKLPKASGNDSHFCGWAKNKGKTVGYIENLVVEHYETTGGQYKRYPDYYKRKFKEEK